MATSPPPTNEEVLEILFLIAPQFVTDDPVKLNQYIILLNQLRCMYNNKLWCCGGALALAQLLAHYLTIAQSPTTGSVSSMTEGQLSISYAVSSSENFWYLTPYGKAFISMRSQIKAGPLVATGCGRIPGTLAWGWFYGTPFGPCC